MDAHETGRQVRLVEDGKEMLSLAHAAERLQDGKRAAHQSWWHSLPGSRSSSTPSTTPPAPTSRSRFT